MLDNSIVVIYMDYDFPTNSFSFLFTFLLLYVRNGMAWQKKKIGKYKTKLIILWYDQFGEN